MIGRWSFKDALRSAFLLAVFLFGSLPTPVSALSVVDYPANGVYWYLPGGRACNTTGPSYSTNMDIPSLTGNDNAEKIWRFLVEKGLSAEQAAGVMGNIQQESNFNPDAREGNGIGYGIAQWSFGRRTALEAAAKEQSVEVSDLGFQLAFMFQESNSRVVSGSVENQGYGTAGDNEWDTLKKQKTIEAATVFWHNNFEVSADSPQKVLDVRGKFAQSAYNSFKALSPGTSTSSSGSGNCVPSGGSGNLMSTLLDYAWPEYKGAGFIEMKPAYAEAVKKAQAEGRGVGGIQHPGIDCAGFISLLMVDSGYEPEYNTRGTYATTIPNRTGLNLTGEAIQRLWMETNWKSLGKGGDINVADLKPGDVAVTRAGSGEHIYVHVGQINGFGNVFASASLDNRAPMAAADFENATNPDYDWFGKR